jgi:hypothetical protein
MCNTLPESARCLFSVGGDVVVLIFSLSAHGTIFYDHFRPTFDNNGLSNGGHADARQDFYWLTDCAHAR